MTDVRRWPLIRMPRPVKAVSWTAVPHVCYEARAAWIAGRFASCLGDAPSRRWPRELTDCRTDLPVVPSTKEHTS